MWTDHAQGVLTEIYIEALLIDEELADQVWELWDAGVITDDLAAWAWSILVLNHYCRGAAIEAGEEGRALRNGVRSAGFPFRLTIRESSLKMIKTAMKLPTGKELEILRLLALHPNGLYGLQLVDLSDGAIKRGSVYVYLARLKGDKLVRSKETPAPDGYGGLPRPVYRITGQGSGVLEATDNYSLALAGATS